MKYKLYEKLTDFFRLRFFSKTNIAVVAVLSIALNIAAAAVAYNEHKAFESLSVLYAGVSAEETDTKPARSGTAESQAQSEASTAQETTAKETTSAETQADTPETAEDESRIYYVTDSGTKYHLESCGYLRTSRNKITLSHAKAKGYTPCSRCIK